MKLQLLILTLFIICSSCSKDDPKVDECTNAEEIDNCFEINETHLTDLKGYVPIIFKNQNNEIVMFNVEDNSLIVLDENLTMVWQKTFNIPIVYDVIQNESGEILLISQKNGETSEVMKLTDDGSVLWKEKIENDSIPFYRSITQTQEKDGYLIAGTLPTLNTDFESLLVVTKIDEDGITEWSKVIDNNKDHRILDILEVQGRYYIFGSSLLQTETGHDFYYYVLDNSGEVSEKKSVGDIFTYFNSLSLADGSILTLSTSFNRLNGGDLDQDFQLIKIDNQGEIAWTKVFGGELKELPASIIPSINGGYYISGSSPSYGFGKRDILLIKIDDNGNVQWQHVYGTSETDNGGAMVQLDNSDLVVVSTGGTDQSEIFIMKLDENGKPK